MCVAAIVFSLEQFIFFVLGRLMILFFFGGEELCFMYLHHFSSVSSIAHVDDGAKTMNSFSIELNTSGGTEVLVATDVMIDEKHLKLCVHYLGC